MSALDARTVRAFALDVDGVLTDNTFVWDGATTELKRFSFADVMGISRARRAGVTFALISGEDSPIVHRLAAKLAIEHVFAGCKDKASALREFSVTTGIALADICFMGNDVNDVEAMALAGLGAAPADAHKCALRVARWVSHFAGGSGAVRELIDALVLDHLEASTP